MGSSRPGGIAARGRATFLAVIAGLLSAAGTVSGSTLVAPHALFMGDDSRSTVLYLQNTGDRAQEIAISLQFGYPMSDDSGNVRVQLVENPAPSDPSAAGWVRAMPRRAVLQPGERQAIRFLARPPADLPAGEYWSRVIVSSQAADPEPRRPVVGSVQAQLYFETRTIVALSFRKGQVSTGVRLNDFQAAVEGSSVAADIRLERMGNAAYLGRLELALFDEVGREVGSWERAIAVYRDLYRRVDMPVGDLPPGRYTLAARVSNDRSDIAAEHLLLAAPVETEMALVVP